MGQGSIPQGSAVGGRRRVDPVVMSWCRGIVSSVAKQTTVRLPDELADEVDAVARAKGTSVNQLIIDSLTAEIDRVREDKDFLATLKRLVDRDQEILDRLAQ